MRERTQENQVMAASSHSRISWSRDMNSGFTLISMLLSNILCEHWDSYVFEADDLIKEGRRTRTGEPEDMGQGSSEEEQGIGQERAATVCGTLSLESHCWVLRNDFISTTGWNSPFGGEEDRMTASITLLDLKGRRDSDGGRVLL